MPAAGSRTVLGIPGSLRRGSYNRLLLRAAADLLPEGVSFHIYEEMKAIPLFDEDLEIETGGGPDSVRRLRREVEMADGVLISTPEYNQSIPGILKNAIDWLSREPDLVLAGKPVAIIGATTGRWGTRISQSVLRHVLYANQALVLVKPSMFVREAGRLFDATGELTDPATSRQLAAVLSALADWIDLVGPRPTMSA